MFYFWSLFISLSLCENAKNPILNYFGSFYKHFRMLSWLDSLTATRQVFSMGQQINPLNWGWHSVLIEKIKCSQGFSINEIWRTHSLLYLPMTFYFKLLNLLKGLKRQENLHFQSVRWQWMCGCVFNLKSGKSTILNLLSYRHLSSYYTNKNRKRVKTQENVKMWLTIC